MSDYVIVCPRGHIQEFPRRVEAEDGGGGEWLCQVCDHRFGVWLEGGELDLGVIPPINPAEPFIFEESFDDAPPRDH